MIFKLEFEDRKEFAQAKNLKHLQEEYAKEYGEEEVLKLKSVTIIDDEVAKTIMLSNNEYNPDLPESDDNFKEFSLYDMVVGDDFIIVGSTDWD